MKKEYQICDRCEHQELVEGRIYDTGRWHEIDLKLYGDAGMSVEKIDLCRKCFCLVLDYVHSIKLKTEMNNQ